MKTFAITFILLFSGKAFAQTDTSKRLDQLKENVENSEKNYEQYKKNYEISAKNKVEAEKAIKQLKHLELELGKNDKTVAQNKAALEKMKQKILSFKKLEQAKIDAESQQIQEVQNVLRRLQANVDKRKLNMVAYDKKVGEIDKEKKDWEQQDKKMAEIKLKLAQKRKDAAKEKSKWQAKAKSYKTETGKWKVQAKSSKNIYRKMDNLN